MIKRTAEVLVIDDRKDEVEPLLKVLNKNGVGLCYYKGTDYSELPETPIEGIRILFLDFALGTDGQSERNKISVLMGVVKKVVSHNNGPYVIFAWTKHDKPEDDLLSAFKKEIMRDTDFPKPVVIINLEKNRCMNNLSEIAKNLKKVFSDKNILEVLFQWENNARGALRDVIKILTDISKPAVEPSQSFDDYSNKWNSELEKHFCKIAEMTLGKKNVKKDPKVLIAAQLALTQPFHDCVEKRIWTNSGRLKNLTSKIVGHLSSRHNPEERAILNTSFLLNCHDLGKDLQPGNVYLLSKVYTNMKCSKKKCHLNKVHLSKNAITGEFFSGKIDEFPNKAALLKGIIPVVIEITPECDYVQNKWKCAKMILGVLWPPEYERNIKDSLFVFKPLLISFRDKTYYLSFNAHHILTLPFSVFKDLSPVFSARKELIADIQHWFSSHISRPGKSEF